MPITYTIDAGRDVIFERWSGEVSADVLESYWRDLLSDTAALECRRTVVDLRGSQIAFNGSELRQLVRTVAVPLLDGRAWTTALVVDAPVSFGIARQYQVFADSYSSDAIFDDEDAAVAWLQAQPRG
jgi:hypothetical protein